MTLHLNWLCFGIAWVLLFLSANLVVGAAGNYNTLAELKLNWTKIDFTVALLFVTLLIPFAICELCGTREWYSLLAAIAVPVVLFVSDHLAGGHFLNKYLDRLDDVPRRALVFYIIGEVLLALIIIFIVSSKSETRSFTMIGRNPSFSAALALVSLMGLALGLLGGLLSWQLYREHIRNACANLATNFGLDKRVTSKLFTTLNFLFMLASLCTIPWLSAKLLGDSMDIGCVVLLLSYHVAYLSLHLIKIPVVLKYDEKLFRAHIR